MRLISVANVLPRGLYVDKAVKVQGADGGVERLPFKVWGEDGEEHSPSSTACAVGNGY